MGSFGTFCLWYVTVHKDLSKEFQTRSPCENANLRPLARGWEDAFLILRCVHSAGRSPFLKACVKRTLKTHMSGRNNQESQSKRCT